MEKRTGGKINEHLVCDDEFCTQKRSGPLQINLRECGICCTQIRSMPAKTYTRYFLGVF